MSSASISIIRTAGGRVACGGSKWSSRASFRLARASSSVPPWLAMSTSWHWETYQFPSCHMVAVKGRFMSSFFHKRAEAIQGVHTSVNAARRSACATSILCSAQRQEVLCSGQRQEFRAVVKSRNSAQSSKAGIQCGSRQLGIHFEFWGLLLGDAGYVQGVGGAFF